MGDEVGTGRVRDVLAGLFFSESGRSRHERSASVYTLVVSKFGGWRDDY